MRLARSLMLVALTAPVAARAEERPGLPVDPAGWTAEKVAARAVEVAPSVKQAQATRTTAEDAAKLGVSAFAPRLDLRASYTRLSLIDPPNIPGFGEFPQYPDNFLLRASLAVPVTDYIFTVLPSFQAAEDLARVASFQAEAESESVALRARESFYLFVRTTAAERVAGDAVMQLEKYLADLEALVGAGEGTPADVLQARSRLAEARVQRSAARGSVRVATEALRLLLDLPAGAAITIAEDVFESARPAAPDAAALVTEAMESRPEVRALHALAESNDAQVRAAHGARYPRLSVVGNVDYASPNQRLFPQVEEFDATWDLSVVLSWSPNDFVSNKVVADQAELERTRVDNDLITLQDMLGSAATQAASDYGVALETISAADEGVTAAREAWRVRRELLAAGEATPSEALETETALRRAELQQIDAHVSARLALARVQHVIGKARARGAE